MLGRLLCCGGGGRGQKATTKPSSSPSTSSSSKPVVTAAAASSASADRNAPAPGGGGDANGDGSKRVGAASTTTTTTSMSTSSSTSTHCPPPPPSKNPPQATTSLPLPEEVWPLITEATERALQSGALSPIETDVAPTSLSTSTATTTATAAAGGGGGEGGRLSDGGWSFVLRVASNLKSKDADGREQKRKEEAASPERPKKAEKNAVPLPPSSKSTAPPPPPIFNPFLPYDQRLWVAHLPPAHELLLNKFPVSMNHALVVTREFEEQCEALDARDLGAAWLVLDSMPGVGGLAFFNRGPQSGASQRHKHLQVVPLPLDGKGSGGGGGGAGEWAPFEGVALAATAAAAAPPLSVVALKGDGDDDDGDSGLPFRAFAARMPPRGGPSPEALAKCVSELVEACFPGEKASTLPENLSFNLLMTRRVAVAVPRRSGTCGAYCSPNAVAFAGSMLARSEEELRFVREKGPMAILAECGVPW